MPEQQLPVRKLSERAEPGSPVQVTCIIWTPVKKGQSFNHAGSTWKVTSVGDPPENVKKALPLGARAMVLEAPAGTTPLAHGTLLKAT